MTANQPIEKLQPGEIQNNTHNSACFTISLNEINGKVAVNWQFTSTTKVDVVVTLYSDSAPENAREYKWARNVQDTPKGTTITPIKWGQGKWTAALVDGANWVYIVKSAES